MPDTSNNPRFRVGDEIELRVRVVRVDEGGYVLSVPGPTLGVWLDFSALSSATLVSPTFKVGDRVRYQGENELPIGRILALHDECAWIELSTGPTTYRLADLERVP